MANRAEMLRRIQGALKRERSAADSRSEIAEQPSKRPLLPVPGNSLIDKFEEELKKVGGLPRRAGSLEELDRIVTEVCPPAGTPSLVLSRNPLILRLNLPERLRGLGYSVHIWPSEGTRPAEEIAEFRSLCFSCVAGFTGADYVLAESGSLVLTSRSEGSQLASVAPPIHIALYFRSQVVETLEEVLEGVRESAGLAPHGSGRSVVFVTGTSRTADIEQVSIRGVHGPLAVYAVLIEESCLQ